jgi:hypothetical protein
MEVFNLSKLISFVSKGAVFVSIALALYSVVAWVSITYSTIFIENAPR